MPQLSAEQELGATRLADEAERLTDEATRLTEMIREHIGCGDWPAAVEAVGRRHSLLETLFAAPGAEQFPPTVIAALEAMRSADAELIGSIELARRSVTERIGAQAQEHRAAARYLEYAH